MTQKEATKRKVADAQFITGIQPSVAGRLHAAEGDRKRYRAMLLGKGGK